MSTTRGTHGHKHSCCGTCASAGAYDASRLTCHHPPPSTAAMRAHTCAAVLTAGYALVNGGVVAHPATHAAASALAAGGRADRRLRSHGAFDVREEGSLSPMDSRSASAATTPEQATIISERSRLRRRLSDFLDSSDVGPIYLILCLMFIGAICTWYGTVSPRPRKCPDRNNHRSSQPPRLSQPSTCNRVLLAVTVHIQNHLQISAPNHLYRPHPLDLPQVRQYAAGYRGG